MWLLVTDKHWDDIALLNCEENPNLAGASFVDIGRMRNTTPFDAALVADAIAHNRVPVDRPAGVHTAVLWDADKAGDGTLAGALPAAKQSHPYLAIGTS